MSVRNPEEWVTASDSNGGSCVEMRRRPDGMIELRDTKDREGPVLEFRTDEIEAMLKGARRGVFDHLV